VAEMALSLYAVNEGYLDKIDVSHIVDYETELHDFARSSHPAELEKINETGDYNDEIEASLKTICDGFAEKGAY
jgi:F-type H+-transporting ATPase subunit alpha